MQNSLFKRSLILALAVAMIISIFTAFTTENVNAATGYVTAKTAIGYKGYIPVYKTASTATQWTYKDNSEVHKAVISNHVYLEYLGRSGSFLQVKWGNSTGYISDTQGVRVDSKPINTTKLASRKKVVAGIWQGYLAFNTYVTYIDSSTGKIKWAPYARSTSDILNDDKWEKPGHAYLYSLM